MDVKQLFAESVKSQQAANKPRTFLIVAEADPAFSPANPKVFRVRGIRTDTNERVYVIAAKANDGQAVPKQGDVLRADKAVSTGKSGAADIPVFTAEYFHTYEKGFCLNAVMQPLPVRKNNNMLDAAVLAYDPQSQASVLTGSQLEVHLVAEIVKQLKPWQAVEKSAITHDLAGKALWANGPTSGMAPVSVVRYGNQSFKVYGIGGVRNDPDNKAAGYRFPNDQELKERVANHPGVQNILKAIQGLSANKATAGQLDDIDVAVLPGVSLAVGRDMIIFNNKANREYFAVPDAYKVMVEGQDSFYGHKNTYIHLKQTRTGRVGVVDTAPAPGKLTAGVPMFAAELERQQYRENLAAGVAPQAASTANQQAVASQRPMTRRDLAAVDDFESASASPEPVQQVVQQPVQQSVQEQIRQATSSDSQDSDHDDQYYDMAGFAEDVAAIERLGHDLGNEEIDSLFDEAQQISAARHQPRMG